MFQLSYEEVKKLEMSSLDNAKTLGGVGAILVLLTIVPTAGWMLGIAGFVMILVAVNYISNDLKDKKIINNMITSVILSIAGVIVASLLVLSVILSAYSNNYFGTTYPYSPAAAVTTAQWITFGTEIAVGLLVGWILFLVSAIYLRRSYNAIGSNLNVHTFDTAGLLYLIGAATTVIGVGFIILFVAEIVTAVAFFSIPERAAQIAQPQAVTVSR
jgi:uncharacterized membrane protein